MRILRRVPAAAESPLALTIGNFDGVHLGHQAMLARLRAAAAERQLPAAAMTFEPHPREFFAPDQAPTRLTSLREKLQLLAGAGMQRAYVCRFNYALAQIGAQDFIDRILVGGLGVRWLLVGEDFRFGARRTGDVALLKQAAARYGFEAHTMPSVTVAGERVSSTAVRAALAAGDLTKAAERLGRPYSISGRVMHGDALGRKLGFPTANVQMKHNRPPLTGIFAVELSGIAAHPLRGVASLGVRPTIRAGGKPVLEVHLFDFDRDIYRRHVQVDFLHKLRDEEKYSDLATLTAQIKQDVADAQSYFHHRDLESRINAQCN